MSAAERNSLVPLVQAYEEVECLKLASNELKIGEITSKFQR